MLEKELEDMKSYVDSGKMPFYNVHQPLVRRNFHKVRYGFIEDMSLSIGP